MPLNAKRRKFCREYMIDGNGTQAAIRAGYAKRSAIQTASRLLTFDNVKGEISRLQALEDKAREVSRQQINDMLIEDRAFAQKHEKPAVVLNATLGYAKVNGHIKEGQQAVTVNVNNTFGKMLAEVEARTPLARDVTPTPKLVEHE